MKTLVGTPDPDLPDGTYRWVVTGIGGQTTNTATSCSAPYLTWTWTNA